MRVSSCHPFYGPLMPRHGFTVAVTIATVFDFGTWLGGPVVVEGVHLSAVGSVAVNSTSAAATVASRAEPIRKVLNMLTTMSDKVVEEADREKKLFDQAMCQCKDEQAELERAINANEEKIPQLQASIQEDEAAVNQLTQEIQTVTADRNKAQSDLESAQRLYDAEKSKLESERDKTIAGIRSLDQAIPIMAPDQASSSTNFLQSDVAQSALADKLRTISSYENSFASARDRKVLLAFIDSLSTAKKGRLRGDRGQAAVETGDEPDTETRGTSLSLVQSPAYDEILGILMGMKDSMTQTRDELIQRISEADTEFSELSTAKGAEISAADSALREKDSALSTTRVRLGNSKLDLESTETTLAQDKQRKENLDTECGQRRKDYEAVLQSMNEEEKAIHETIAILNNGGVEELFKNTLPLPGKGAASFLQVRAGVHARKHRRSGKRLGSAKKRRLKKGSRRQRQKPGHKTQQKTKPRDESAPRDAFLAVLDGDVAKASQPEGLQKGLQAVPSLVEKLLQQLGAEQANDDKHFLNCREELTRNEDRLEALKKEAEDATTDKASFREQLTTVEQELEELRAGIKTLDQEVEQATEQRKAENAEYVNQLASAHAAVGLLQIAKNRLEQFYNSNAAFVQQNRQQRLVEDFGNTSAAVSPAAVSMKEKTTDAVRSTDATAHATGRGDKAFGQEGGEAEAESDNQEQRENDEATETEEQEDDAARPDRPLAFIQEDASAEEEHAASSQEEDEEGNQEEEQEEEETEDTAAEQEAQDSAAEESAEDSRSEEDALQDSEEDEVEQQGDRDTRVDTQAKQPQDVSGFSSAIALINEIQGDVKAEAENSKTAEADAQREYEDWMRMSSDTRSNDAKAAVEKEGVRTQLQETLVKLDEKLSMIEDESKRLTEVVAGLHDQCDSLMQHYEDRKIARRGEAESLRKAQATLEGADVQ